MPEFSGRHYMNPSYGRAMAQADGDDGTNDDAAAHEAARNGRLKHVTIHVQHDGGFSVQAHYQHASAGHHTVDSKHASAADAAGEAKKHLRGHELRRAAGDAGTSCDDES
ncbi:MAG TPA: hypothetical protein VMS37_13855 [Verrucomicrobiae bacterium]|nr:hypothetical protein [Verrucomicrobiae bacterium]